MIKRFYKDERGGLVEYMILLAVAAVCSVLLFPSLRSNMVEWNNTMICNITKSIGSGKDCANTNTTPDKNDGFDTNKPDNSNNTKPPVTTEPPKETKPPEPPKETKPPEPPKETKPPEPIKPPEETKPPVKQNKYVVKYDRTIPYRYDNIGTHEVKIVLNPSNFDYSLSKKEGKDIKFILPDGRTLSSFIEKWNPKGESVAWVKSLMKETKQLEMVVDDSYTSKNDPNEVFRFYETFDKPLDPKIWYVPPEYEDRVYVKDGALYLDRATIGIKKTLWMRYATIKVDTKTIEGDTAQGLMISNKLLKDATAPGLELLSIHPSESLIQNDNYTYLEMRNLTGSKDSPKGTRYSSSGYKFPIDGWAQYDIFIDTDVDDTERHWVDYAHAKQRGEKEFLSKDVINELPNRNYIWLGYWEEDPEELEYIEGVTAFDSIIIHQGEEPIIGTVEKQ
ncbi:DUF2341 domain-containing protein [Bacillus cereus]|uniref:DUF2341 domain-containing protein n=1 Tax=Bacillus cereus TaxID=1396 RepID=UPI00159514F8|nr:DUF2341 domain-containing protein [Bacillus cereus]